MLLTGAIGPGEKLPSVRELAGQLAINPNTIQRAYRELEKEGYIDTVAGKGAFASTAGDAGKQRQQDLLVRLEQTVQELLLVGMTRDDIAEAVRQGGKGETDT
jgi:GntR family transcriptional regulator